MLKRPPGPMWQQPEALSRCRRGVRSRAPNFKGKLLAGWAVCERMVPKPDSGVRYGDLAWLGRRQLRKIDRADPSYRD